MAAAKRSLARRSLTVFLKELGLDDVAVTRVYVKGRSMLDGRVFYRLRRHGRVCNIDVPRKAPDVIKAERWRFLVDGSSWIWEYALDRVRSVLTGPCPACGQSSTRP